MIPGNLCVQKSRNNIDDSQGLEDQHLLENGTTAPAPRHLVPHNHPHYRGHHKAAKDGKTKQVGTVNGGWPLKSDIAFTTKKGNGLAVTAQAALNSLIGNGTCGKILERWGAFFGGGCEVVAESAGIAEEVVLVFYGVGRGGPGVAGGSRVAGAVL